MIEKQDFINLSISSSKGYASVILSEPDVALLGKRKYSVMSYFVEVNSFSNFNLFQYCVKLFLLKMFNFDT